MSSEAKQAPKEQGMDVMGTFIEGARNGLKISFNNMVPNIVLAFTLVQFINKLGIMGFIGKIFGPIMALFGLPGEAVTVLLAAWLAMGSGVGVAASLFSNGIINGQHVTILMPAIYLMGAQLNYSSRCLGLAELPHKYWKWAFLVCILNAFIAMLIMRVIA